ncbi:MAG: RNA polymerase sigma factor RpoD, partial [Gammaproteobacteria bacterium]|nr:RNA polymerase sigma factor RpoD [Gammaproteobacteria bacterium]
TLARQFLRVEFQPDLLEQLATRLHELASEVRDAGGTQQIAPIESAAGLPVAELLSACDRLTQGEAKAGQARNAMVEANLR